MMLRKTQLVVAVGGALLAGATAVQAQSSSVLSRDKDPQVTLYGQVGRALMFVDDGVQSKWFHNDAESDGTRLGLRGSTQVMPGLRAGFRFEFEIQSNSTDRVNMTTESQRETSHARERFQEVILQGAWGQLNIGQGEPAADNSVSRDLSNVRPGTAAVDFGAKFLWRTAAGGTVGPMLDQTHSQLDFNSRYDRFMYTSPTFGGFWVQASNGQLEAPSNAVEVTELGLWYRGKLAGDIEAAIGWAKENSGAAGIDDNEQMGGSVSWLHTSGFNVTLGYSKKELFTAPGVSRDQEWTYGKVGYKFGPHAVAVGYGMGNDQAQIGDEGDVMHVGYTWSPTRWFDVFALYQVFTLDRPGVQVEDITVGSVGVAVRF